MALKKGARSLTGASFLFAHLGLYFKRIPDCQDDDLVKSAEPMALIAGARCFAPDIGHAPRAPTMPCAQRIVGASGHSPQGDRNDEVAAQRRRWIFMKPSPLVEVMISFSEAGRKLSNKPIFSDMNRPCWAI